MMPTMTSATIRPPTSPRRSPPPRTAASRRMYSHSGVSSCQSPRASSCRVSGCAPTARATARSEEHTSELQSQSNLVCRLLLEKKNTVPISSRRASERRSRYIVAAVSDKDLSLALVALHASHYYLIVGRQRHIQLLAFDTLALH